ncbi:MAG: adaptor protein MecA [Lachnospiraceae bacterium]
MKIEKLSDNQIRCTLNKADLSERELKISELAYGTEKAKELFREMMQQASYEFGFEAEDLPLMIEAIPVSSDCIILVITKVDDPEELDTRFSKFSPASDEDGSESESDFEDDDIASLFSKIQEIRDSIELNGADFSRVESISSDDNSDDFISMKGTAKKNLSNKKIEKKNTAAESDDGKPHRLLRSFSFESFDKVSTACEHAHYSFSGDSALYKDSVNRKYFLILSDMSTSVEAFNMVCNSLSEFGTRVKINNSSEDYYKEHYECIIKENAIAVLGNL